MAVGCSNSCNLVSRVTVLKNKLDYTYFGSRGRCIGAVFVPLSSLRSDGVKESVSSKAVTFRSFEKLLYGK